METVVRVDDVEAVPTKSGNTRWIVRSNDGQEFTTFRPEIGQQAERFRGKPARVEYHEEQRGNFHNVYLDAIAPASAADGPHTGAKTAADADAETAAWATAMDAAPWLVGPPDAGDSVEPKELYERLREFKDLVADDIRDDSDRR